MTEDELRPTPAPVQYISAPAAARAAERTLSRAGN